MTSTKLSIGARTALTIAVVAVPTLGAGVASSAAAPLAAPSSGPAVERALDGEYLAGRFGPPWGLVVNCYNPVWARLLKCRGPIA